jgi:hypothetical protein
MKTKLKLTATIIALFASPLAFAADEHDHDHGGGSSEAHAAHDEHGHLKTGPNGGHVVESKAGFTFEVTVDKDRKARIVFLDKDLKASALAGQSITGIAGERSAPTKLAFAKGVDADANVLVSDTALPAGAHIPMLLVIKTSPDAKAVTERFEIHLH